MYWQLQHVIFVWQSWHLVTLRHFQCRFAWPAHYVRLKEKCVCSDRRIFLVSIPTSSNVSTPLVAQGIVNMCLLNHRSCISFFFAQGRSAVPEIDNTSFGMASFCVDAPLASTKFKHYKRWSVLRLVDFSFTSNSAKTTFEPCFQQHFWIF